MVLNFVRVGGPFVFLLAAGSAAQLEFAADKIPDGAVTIDGYLNESVWSSSSAGKNKMDNTKVIIGVIDGDADCYAEWVTLWDNTGVYFGYWFHDDFHNAPHSMFLADANNAYDDDGVDLFIDISFDDAWNDVTDEYRGDLGWQLLRGLGNDNPAEQYAGHWATVNGTWFTENWDVDQQHNKGWNAVFTTANGVDYEHEMQFTWAGEIMRANGTPNQGLAMGIDPRVEDNDGAFSREGSIRYTTFSHQGSSGSGQHWSKLTLAGLQGIFRPIALPVRNAEGNPANYDLLGRKFSSALGNGTAIRFAVDRNLRPAKTLAVR